MGTEMWNSVAEAWARNAEFVDGHLAAATEALLDAAHVGPGDSVLDLACGPGGTGLAAAERVGADGRVGLADAAEAMVAAATRRADGRSQVSSMVCDQDAISVPDESFDAVVVRHGLMFAPDPAATVREAVRVLRPGGHYAAMTWARRDANPWLGLILDAVGEQFGVEFPPPGIPGPFSLDDPDRLAATFHDGGLDEVQVRTIFTPLTVDSLDEWWERVPQLAGPVAVAMQGLEPDVRDAIRRRALGAAAARARPTGEQITLDGSVVVAAGRRPTPPGAPERTARR